MKKILLALLLLGSFHAKAADTLFIKQPQVPILIERHDNMMPRKLRRWITLKSTLTRLSQSIK